MSLGRSWIVMNPRARDGRLMAEWTRREAQIREALGASNVETHYTSAEDHGDKTAREAVERAVDRLVVVGGDGTLSKVISGWMELGLAADRLPTLAVMPAGRGDDFFKTVSGRRVLGADGAWELALEILRRNDPRPIDVGSLQFFVSGQIEPTRYFINVASFGYPGRVVQRVLGKEGWLGRGFLGRSAWTYTMHSVAAALEYKPVGIRVRADGKEIYQGPLHSGFVLNGAYNAGGVRWSDELKLDDGKFEGLIFEPRSGLNTLMTIDRLWTGDWKGAKGVHRFSGREIEVYQAEGVDRRTHPLFEIDGDLPEPRKTEGARFRTMAGAVRVLR